MSTSLVKAAGQRVYCRRALKEQEKLATAQEAEARAALLFDPNSEFGDRFEAVMTDFLLVVTYHKQTLSETDYYHTPKEQEKPEDENSTDDF